MYVDCFCLWKSTYTKKVQSTRKSESTKIWLTLFFRLIFIFVRLEYEFNSNLSRTTIGHFEMWTLFWILRSYSEVYEILYSSSSLNDWVSSIIFFWIRTRPTFILVITNSKGIHREMQIILVFKTKHIFFKKITNKTIDTRITGHSLMLNNIDVASFI